MNGEDDLIAKAMTEMKAMESLGIKIILELGISDAMALIGALQLACRHPEFVGPTRYSVEKIIGQLFTNFEGKPALQELIRMGWQRKHDG
jgi:hypothetical protein